MIIEMLIIEIFVIFGAICGVIALATMLLELIYGEGWR